ncbi:protein TOPAZ1 [Phaethornis superciliosus]
MLQFSSGKVVTESEVKLADQMVTSPSCLGSGVGCKPRKKLVVKQSPHLAPNRKPEQPLSSCLQPAQLSSLSCKQSAPLVPMQEKGESSPGEKKTFRRAARRRKGLSLPLADTAVCEDWQAAATAVGACWEETVRTGMGQGQELIFSGTTLQDKFIAGIERKEHSSEGLNLSGFRGSLGNSGEKGKYSPMEIKLQIPSSREEIEGTEKYGVCFLPEPEVLQPCKGTCSTEMKSFDPLMILEMQIPDLKNSLENSQESLSEPKPQEEVDALEILVDECSLIESRKPGTQEDGKRCFRKKGRTSFRKQKCQYPIERSRSALLGPHAQCPESEKGAVRLRKRSRNTLVSQQLQGVTALEQPAARGDMKESCMEEEQQSADSEKGADSMGESADEKQNTIEQDTGTQAVKKLKINCNSPEDPKEKEPHYSRSPLVSKLGGTKSRSFMGHSVTKESGVHYKNCKPRKDQISCLESFSVTTAEEVIDASSAPWDAEHGRNTLDHCNGLLCAAGKNPFVRLEACSHISKLVESSASGATTSYKLSGLFHVAHDKRMHVLPGGPVEQSDRNCSTSRMQNETSPIKGGVLVTEEKNQEGCFSCCQTENSKCLRGERWNNGRKPRKRKITEKSSVQNISTDMANECCECELQTGTAAMSSSCAVLGLNHKEITSAALCDHPSGLHVGKTTSESQNPSVCRKSSTRLLAFEDGFEKTGELSVIGRGENAHCSAASGSLRELAQVHGVSNCYKSKTKRKLKANKNLHQVTCQRTVPMTGKNVWPFESCARTSEWVPKNHGSISEAKRLLKAAPEESSDKSSLKAIGNSAVPENLVQLDLQMSLAEINKESTHKIMDPNTECHTSVKTTESSSMDIYENLRTSNEILESLVSKDRSVMAFTPEDVQEVKTTLTVVTKQKDKNKGAVAKRNLSVTVLNGKSADSKTRLNLSHKVKEVNQVVSDLKPKKVVNTGNLTKFKIPLCRNKPESRKLESVHSFERKNFGPLELLDSSGVSRSQKAGEETLVNSAKQPLPVTSDAISTASMKKKVDEINSKDLEHDGSENLNELSVLPENFSLYPHPFFGGQLESPVPDVPGTECVLKSSFPDHSWNAVDCPVAVEINGDSKSRENLSQHKSQSFPDILEAYEEDVLIIDVIQDDPDLFGTSKEEELAIADCRNSPVKGSYTSVCIKEEKEDLKPEYPGISKNSNSVDDHFRHITIEESAMLNDTENSCDWVLKATDIKTRNSSRGSSPLGGVIGEFLGDTQLDDLDELLKSYDMDEKFSFADGVPDVEQEKKGGAEKSEYKYKDLVNCELLSGLPLHPSKIKGLNEATVMNPQKNGQSPLLPLQNDGDFEPLRTEKNAVVSHSVQQMLEMIELPRKYCRLYFMTLRGCERAKCWFWHVPEQGHEKICMAILRTYISIKESGLLKRAVEIFMKYYREVTPGVNFASRVLNDLLISLLKNCLLQEVFQILNLTVQINTLPAVDVVLKIFEHVASWNRRDAVPTLITTFHKLIDAGMFLEFEHFDYIIKFLHKFQVSSQEVNIVLNMKSRLQERHFEKDWVFDFNLAVAEMQHCKLKSDWTKLGALYVNTRTGCEHFEDLQKLSLCIGEILAGDSETDRSEVPFCDFADAVIKNSKHNEGDRIFIGRTGISVMCSYHKVLQWMKGRKVLDKLRELQIHFTVLKGLTGAESVASRCQIVNKAAEIFLKTGSLDGATWILRESEWTTNSPLWPCNNTDLLNRHNLLCTLVHKYLRKSLYRQAFEVLQNLPGFHNHSDTVGVSQYSSLFNKLINACFESRNLGVSSSAVDFMLSKNIAIDLFLLRGLITALGRSSLWSKARTYYKSALSLGCYPPLQGNLYHKVLMIPSYLSEVEMLLAIEIFLVSNANDIRNPMATSQTLQIILKRCEDQTVQNNSDYQAAVERLILAARLSDPKLFLKHMTMNVNMEEVYSLELTSALKWIQENMKWARNVWLFQQSLSEQRKRNTQPPVANAKRFARTPTKLRHNPHQRPRRHFRPASPRAEGAGGACAGGEHRGRGGSRERRRPLAPSSSPRSAPGGNSLARRRPAPLRPLPPPPGPSTGSAAPGDGDGAPGGRCPAVAVREGRAGGRGIDREGRRWREGRGKGRVGGERGGVAARPRGGRLGRRQRWWTVRGRSRAGEGCAETDGARGPYTRGGALVAAERGRQVGSGAGSGGSSVGRVPSPPPPSQGLPKVARTTAASVLPVAESPGACSGTVSGPRPSSSACRGAAAVRRVRAIAGGSVPFVMLWGKARNAPPQLLCG